MGNPIKVEDVERVYLITTRTIGSRLWFVHNQKLHERILAFLARYQEMYGVILYAFVLMGNHYHLIARFPRGNKAAFMRDFNSIIARLVATEVPNYPGGRLWARRYAEQVLPNDFDVSHWYLYVVLNPITTGICYSMADFPGYSSLRDNLSLRSRKFQVFERWKFNEAKRNNAKASPQRFIQEHSLKFSKLPQLEHLEDSAYQRELRRRIDERQQQLQSQMLAADPRSPMRRIRAEPVVGSKPITTKMGTRSFGRPLVLSLSSKSREEFLRFYFATRDAYRLASKAFRTGLLNVAFPPGTYRPSTFAT